MDIKYSATSRLIVLQWMIIINEISSKYVCLQPIWLCTIMISWKHKMWFLIAYSNIHSPSNVKWIIVKIAVHKFHNLSPSGVVHGTLCFKLLIVLCVVWCLAACYLFCFVVKC